MSEWVEVELEQLGNLSSGKSIKPGGIGEFTVFGSNGAIGGSDEYRHEQGIIIGRVGAYCGSVEVSGRPFWASDNTIVLEPDRVSDLRFVYFLLKHADLNRHAGGSAQPLLTQKTLKTLRFRVPDEETRTRISDVLGSIDDLIENNRRRIEVLEEMAQAIYREWFVHFRYPGHEDATFVDSPLGPIPEGWEVTTLGELVELKYGKALKKADRAGGIVSVVGSSGIVGTHDKPLLQGPSIVVGRKGNVGNVIWIPGPSWPIDTTYYVETALPLRYVAEQLKRADFINSHAAVPGLSRDQAYSVNFLRPTDDAMRGFQKITDLLGKNVQALLKASGRLASIRDLLLPKLVTGEIDVSDLDLDALFEVAP